MGYLSSFKDSKGQLNTVILLCSLFYFFCINDTCMLDFRFIYENWLMPHTAAKLKFPFLWDEECLEVEPPPKDEL